MAASRYSNMENVLLKLGIQDLADIFNREKVSPDIVCLLSFVELQSLGVTKTEDMVKLRTECIKYGASQPQKVKLGAGPPMFDIPKDLLENLIDQGFLISDVSKLLSVSESTVYRRMSQFGISKANFSELDDNEVDFHVANAIKDFPFCGENLLNHMLKQKGLQIQRGRLRESIHRLDEGGVKERKRGCLKRRVYNVQGPNHLWHIDSNHKLIRWHFIIAGGIDGFSRMIVYLQCLNNNKAETLLQCFREAVTNYGLPMRVRSDKGMENVRIADYMIQYRGPGRGSMITGKSVHNQRVERMWRDVYVGVLSFYYGLFSFMEEEGILDPLNEMHVFALHYTYLHKINEKLKIWAEAWANHRVRTIHSSPRSMWVAGQLRNPVGTDINVTDLDNYGLEGIVGNNDALVDVRPNMSTPSYNLSENCRIRLEREIPFTWVSSQFGVDVYKNVLQLITTDTDSSL